MILDYHTVNINLTQNDLGGRLELERSVPELVINCLLSGRSRSIDVGGMPLELVPTASGRGYKVGCGLVAAWFTLKSSNVEELSPWLAGYFPLF